MQMVMKLAKILRSISLFVFVGLDRAQNYGYVIQPMCVSTKQKIVHGRGPSNINLVIFVCSFEVGRVS